MLRPSYWKLTKKGHSEAAGHRHIEAWASPILCDRCCNSMRSLYQSRSRRDRSRLAGLVPGGKDF